MLIADVYFSETIESIRMNAYQECTVCCANSQLMRFLSSAVHQLFKQYCEKGIPNN